MGCCASESNSGIYVIGPCHCDTSEQAGYNEINEEEEEEVDLEKLALEDTLDGDDTLDQALNDLRQAMQLYQKGLCFEAAEKLAAAEALIERSPDSPSRRSMIALCQKNPEIKDLRASTKVMGDLSPKPCIDDPFSLKKSNGSTGEDVTAVSLDEEAAPVDEEEDLIKELIQKMELLEAALSKVRDFCRSGKVFEAHESLKELEADMENTLRLGSRKPECSPMKFLSVLKQKLEIDPLLLKLRSVHERMCTALAVLQTPARADRGVKLDLKDPEIGDDFRLEMRIRFAEGAERVKNGPATQILIQCSLFNYPASLLHLTAADCETDLMRKEWIKDASLLTGKAGRPARLYCAQVHTTMSPPMLPIKLDDVIFREFAVCSGEGKLPNIGPGVMVVEYRAPVGVKDFEGMAIPGKKKSTVRITDGRTYFYKTQSKNPACSNMQVVATVGLPVPQMILPLSLLKNFAADAMRESFKRIKLGLFDNWDALEHQSRIDSNPDLYGGIREIPADKLD